MRANRSVKYSVALAPAARSSAADANGSAFDVRGYGIAEFIVNNGTPSAGGTSTVRIQETTEDPASPGNPLASGWADVALATTGAMSAAGQKVIQLDCQKRKAFLRCVALDAVAAVTTGVTLVRREGTRTQPETAPDVAIGFD